MKTVNMDNAGGHSIKRLLLEKNLGIGHQEVPDLAIVFENTFRDFNLVLFGKFAYYFGAIFILLVQNLVHCFVRMRILESV